MLIICENHNGDTPQTAIPFGSRRLYSSQIPYVSWAGDARLPAGVYLQRYSPVFELGQQRTVYIPQRLELDDRVQETASVDHPGNQP